MEGVGILKPQFWQNKSVLITGHTGFKGSWLAIWLHRLGANVSGYALPPPTEPSLFKCAAVDGCIRSTLADIRDLTALKRTIASAQPEFVFHLAAQSLVRPSYQDPVDTFSANVMGTVNLLEAIRSAESVKAVIIVTSDKCYENREWPWGYRENDAMGGQDPYSCSKACAELVTASYRSSFFNPSDPLHPAVAIASVRAGNVIGGGDWAADRLIPDLVRSISGNRPTIVRNPAATRPWQHVLEPLGGYLTLAEFIGQGGSGAEAWNFGPADENVRSVADVCGRFTSCWGQKAGWKQDDACHPHEAGLLKLDSSKARHTLGWSTLLGFEESIDWTLDWYRGYLAGHDGLELTTRDIDRYQNALSSANQEYVP
jgi:CDP-glucose 4,6-dehydratase